jgi:hypothetical protein
VDGKDQQESYSRQKCHYEGNLLQMAGMENTVAYPGTHAERWCLVIQAPDPADACIIDLNFMAEGGTFDYNTAGLDCPIDQVEFAGIEEAEWISLEGSLAGKDIPLYSQKGHGWMKAVRKMNTSGNVSWTYPYRGASLKIHALSNGDEREIICCLGEKGSEEPFKSGWDPYVVWRDKSADPKTHTAVIATLLEPFEQRRFIRSILPLSLESGSFRSRFQPTGIEIAYDDSRYRDVVLSSYEEGEIVRFRDSQGTVYETDARALLLRYLDSKLIRAEAVRYSRIAAGDRVWIASCSSYRGEVVEVDAEACLIQVELEQADDGLEVAWAGQAALIDSCDYVKPSPYLLNEPKVEGRRLTFHTGIPLIKLEEGWHSPFKQLGLGNKRVVEYRGKQVHIDVKPGDSFVLANALRYECCEDIIEPGRENI